MNAKLAKVLIKTTGVIGAGLVIYDMHKSGVSKSQMSIKKGIAKRLPDAYNQSRKQEGMSTLNSEVHDYVFNESVNNSVPDKINGVKGYLKGAFFQLASSIIPATFATLALLKGKVISSVGAIGLAVYGAGSVLFNVLDIGKIKHFRERKF